MFSDGLRVGQDGSFLHRRPAGRPNEASNVLSGVAVDAEVRQGRIREKGMEAFASMDEVSVGLIVVPNGTIISIAFGRHKLDDIGVSVKAKTVALHYYRKAHPDRKAILGSWNASTSRRRDDGDWCPDR